MKKPNNCLETQDLNGKKIVFHEKRRKKKAKTHPLLNDLRPNGFVKKKIPEALANPDRINQDLTNPKVRNYYKEEYYINTRWSRVYVYTKVVVATMWNPWVILTAYQPPNIKEEWGGYKKCLYKKR